MTIRPGTDALLLAAMTYVLFEEKLVDLRDLAPHVHDVEELATAVRDFAEAASEACDVDADTIRELARELAAAPTAAVYGRIGSCTVPHGTLASWLVDVLNILTGNLDRPAAPSSRKPPPTRPPAPPEPGRGFALGRWHSRVSRHPEAKGELPLAALAEEIDTATHEGSPVRALIAIAANPVLSAPDGNRLDKALDLLDFMVSVDPYLNGPARHARRRTAAAPALPERPPRLRLQHPRRTQPGPLQPPRRPSLEPGRMAETEILARLVLAATGMHGADPSAVDAMVIDSTLGKAVQDPHGPVHERDPKELATRLTGESGPERRLDMMLRLGPYGEGFGARPDGLSLELLAHPHGIDLGPLRPSAAAEDAQRKDRAAAGADRRRSSGCAPPCASVRPRSSSSAAAICAPTAGCTTSPPSPAAPTAAPCTSTPRTRHASAWPTGRPCASRAPGEKWSPRPRSRTPYDVGW